MVPVLLAVLVSYLISNQLSIGIFDVLLEMKQLPYLPSLRSEESYNYCAKDIMNENYLHLTEKSTLSEAMILVSENIDMIDSIPVL